MRINEIFVGVQGEGALTGTVSEFVRMSGCNLNCDWCDTKYHKDGVEMSIDDISKRLVLYNIVITGGEPTQQPEELIKLCKLLYGWHHITIETNGTKFINCKSNLFSISPKMKSSGNKNTINIDEITKFLKSGVQCQLKFVISTLEDFNQMTDLILNYTPDFLDDICCPIILQPNGQCELDEYIQRARWLENLLLHSNLVENYDIRLLLQNHKIIWGGERGK